MYPKNIYILQNEQSDTRKRVATLIQKRRHSRCERSRAQLGIPSDDSDNYLIDIHLHNDREDIRDDDDREVCHVW